MAVQLVVFCDKCGSQKKEVNHWWVIDKCDPLAVPTIWSIRMMVPKDVEDDMARAIPNRVFMCGVNCALQYLQEQIAGYGNEKTSR